jgi:hypothetical protein
LLVAKTIDGTPPVKNPPMDVVDPPEEPEVTPEPATLALGAVGAAMVAWRKRRK